MELSCSVYFDSLQVNFLMTLTLVRDGDDSGVEWIIVTSFLKVALMKFMFVK